MLQGMILQEMLPTALLLAFCFASAFYLWERPFDLNAIIGALCCWVYIAPIVIVEYHCNGCFQYPFSILGVTEPHYRLDSYDVYLHLAGVAFFYFVTFYFSKKTNKFCCVRFEWEQGRSGFWVIAFLGIFVFSLAYVQSFLPGFIGWIDYGKYIKDRSFAVPVVFAVQFIPCILGLVFYLRRGSFIGLPLLMLALSALLAFASGVRANVFTVVIFFFVGSYIFDPTLKDRVRMRIQSISGKTKLTVLTAAATSIPLLWVLRNQRRFIEEGTFDLMSVAEVNRGFAELIFGSGASGGATYIILKDFIGQEGYGWGSVFYMPFLMLIPRGVWSDKPVNIDSKIQDVLNLWTSPSVFLPNELYYSFSYVYPIAMGGCAFLFAWIMYRAFQGGVLFKLFYCSMLAYSIAIFKNGLIVVVPKVALLFILSVIIFKLVYRFDKSFRA